MRTEIVCISVSRVASGSRMKMASFKMLNPPPIPPPPSTLLQVVDSTDQSKAVVLVLVLLFVYSTKRFVLKFAFCYFGLVFFSPLSIAITSLGEERVNLSVFVRLFDLRLFGFVCFLFLLASGKGCGL